MAEDADQALPGEQFLFAQRAGKVGEHQEMKREAPFAKNRSGNPPASGPAREGPLHRALRLAFEEFRQAQVFCLQVGDALSGTGQKTLRGPVDEAEAPLGVEGEDGDFDLLHHLSEQSGRLEGSQALGAQGGAHGVHLLHHFAHGVLPPRSTGSDGVIAFAHRFEQVRQRAKRRRHSFLDREGETEQDGGDQNGERPAHLGGVIPVQRITITVRVAGAAAANVIRKIRCSCTIFGLLGRGIRIYPRRSESCMLSLVCANSLATLGVTFACLWIPA